MSPYEPTWARFSLKDHGSAISGGRQAVQHCRHKSDYIYTRQKGKLQGRKGHVAIVQYLAEQLATGPCSQPPRILAPRKLHLNLGDLSAHLGVETEISMLKR